MLPIKLPAQLVRLALLTVAIVGLYIAARIALTPSSFGQYGWFRGDALEEIAARQPVFSGQKSCAECHEKQFQVLAKAEHKTLSCESCHWDTRPHVEDRQIKIPRLTDSHCIRCHDRSPSRPAWLKQITSKIHYKGQPCTECHIPHQPNEVP
jgi:hypothetical protein